MVFKFQQQKTLSQRQIFPEFKFTAYNQSKKTLIVYKATMYGRYESKLENSKNGFEATLSRVEFQTGPYKTSHSKYLK